MKGTGTRGIRATFQEQSGQSFQSVTNNLAYTFATWHRLVVTLSATDVEIYIDGVNISAGVGYLSKNLGTPIVGFSPSSVKMRLGGGQVAGSETISINGSAAHLWVWNHDLTAQEVTDDSNFDFSVSITLCLKGLYQRF